MNPVVWDDEEPEPEATGGQPQSALASLHFARAALRRKRRTWLIGALCGLLAAMALLLIHPGAYTAETTLVLAHDPNQDSGNAIATDVSLATTRDVAQQTIRALGLSMTPQSLVSSVKVVPTTSDVMTISLEARTGNEARRRLAAFTSAYLVFRSQQLSAQSDALVNGLNSRISSLQDQVKTLTTQIESLATKSGAADVSQLNDALSERSQLGAQITTLQESAQDATVKTTSIIASSRVIDAPAVIPGSALKRMIVILLAGLIGGAGLTAGSIVVLAITSDRIRLRAEVVAVLEVPVTASVRRIVPLRRSLRQLPLLRSIDAARTRDRQRVANAITSAIPSSGSGQWLAVGCVDNADEMVFAVAEAALTMQKRGQTIRLIDLTERGRLNAAVETLYPWHEIRVPVLRPKGIPSLVSDIGEIEIYGPRTSEIPALRESDVFLAISDLQPSLGAAHLSSWTHRVLIGVTAAQSSAERLRTAADMVGAANLSLWSAVLLDTESTDNSSGAFHGAGIQVAAD